MRIIRGTDLPFVAASHEDAQRPGVLKRVLATKDELIDGRIQMINWARLPEGSSFRAHYHEDMEEVFIVLTGRVEMIVDGDTWDLHPGDAMLVEPHEVHQMSNRVDHDVDYIVIGISTGKNGKTIVV